MVPEARIEQTAAGLVPAGVGWFVLNAREALWRRREGRGHNLQLTGSSYAEAAANFSQIGIQLYVLGTGEPMRMYHWEADQENFVVLSGEPLLIIEGQERRLRPWDFVHCPPATRHTIIGAGDGPCVVLAVGAREHMADPVNGGAYTVYDAALRHGAGVEEETTDGERANARFPDPEPTPYRDGWLPSG